MVAETLIVGVGLLIGAIIVGIARASDIITKIRGAFTNDQKQRKYHDEVMDRLDDIEGNQDELANRVDSVALVTIQVVEEIEGDVTEAQDVMDVDGDPDIFDDD